MDPLISIIMPMYNTEAYVAGAVRSVQAQTYANWELLIVDDGSTDGSGALCDELAASDSRIRVFHKENGGVSRARNFALAQAKGEYICFLDSDDACEPDYLAFFVSHLAPGIPVCCGYFEDRSGALSSPALPMETSPVPTDDFLFEGLLGRLNMPLVCWSWIFPAEPAKNVSFDSSLVLGEDSLYAAQVLLAFEQVYYDPVPLYRYRIDREGNTVGKISLKKCESGYASLEKTLALYAGRRPRTEQVLIKHLTERAAAAARQARREGRPEKVREYKKKAFSCWKKLRRCPEISRNDKIRLLGYSVFPSLSEKLMLRFYGRV